MKICGIIVEYNPFHNGHLYQIEQIKKKLNPDLIICVMSGNFVQRGEISIIDKWERTNTCLDHGVDLVIELPYIYATQSASYFAKGACKLLELLKVDYIAFGSESGNLSYLKELADQKLIVPDDKKHSHVFNFQTNYELKSNDILGLSYLKALKHTTIEPFIIKRTNNDYLDTQLKSTISSATSIRLACLNKQSYEHATPMELMNPHFNYELFDLLKHQLLTDPFLNKYFLVDEGIENHLKKQIKTCKSYEEFINNATTKRYPTSTIQRICLQIINHITKEEVNKLPPLNYLRVLGFNQKAQKYLNTLKKDTLIITKFKDIPTPYRLIEEKALATYQLINPNYNELRPPIIKKTSL